MNTYPNSQIETDWFFARLQFAQGKWMIARGYFDAILRQEPRDANALYYRALCNLHLGESQAAFNDFGQALLADPKHVWAAQAHYNRGDHYQELGNLSAAIEEYTQAIVLSAASEPRLERGICRLGLNQIPGAIDDFTYCIKRSCLLDQAWFYRGKAHLFLKNWDKARADFDQDIRIDPDSAMGFALRGECRMRNDDVIGAIADCSEAIRLIETLLSIEGNGQTVILTPGGGEVSLAVGQTACYDGEKKVTLSHPQLSYAYEMRGQCRLIQREQRKAFADFRQAIRYDPLNASPYASIGDYHMEVYDWKKAIVAFSRAIQIEPNDARTRTWRGECYHETGELDLALLDFDEAIRLQPDLAVPYLCRAQLHAARKEWEWVLADYHRAQQIEGKLGTLAHYQCALGYAHLGRTEEYMNHAAALRKMKPQMPLRAEVRFLHGLGDLDQHQHKKAVRELARCIRLYERFGGCRPTHYQLYGEALFQTDQFKKALQAFNNAIRLNRKCAMAYYWRGCCLKRYRRRRPDALGAFNKAISLAVESIESAPFYCERGHCYLLLKDLREAEVDLSLAIELDDQLARAHVFRMALFVMKKDFWGALTDMEALLSFPPEHPGLPEQEDLYDASAHFNEEVGRHAEARADRRRAKAIRKEKRRRKEEDLRGND